MAEQREMNESEVRERVRRLLAEIHPERSNAIAFRRKQYEHGLAWVHFPEGFGGLGISPRMQAIVSDELSLHSKVIHRDPPASLIGIGMGAPTVLTYGSEELKRRLLPAIFSGEEIWCQMFSEPGAGSDVAGLATRAVRDGDDWVVNGQKVWTSVAHLARWGMLLARTNPDVPKHDGLSYFVLDMQTPGVSVRPLYQITGEAEFNEVFFDNVRIPHSHLLGREGQGWRVAITTLMNERAAIGGADSTRKGSGTIAQLVELWRTRKLGTRSAYEEALLRDRVVRAWMDKELLRITNQRARAAQKAGNPGPEGSVAKLAMAEGSKRMWETALDVLGQDGLAFEAGFSLRQSGTEARSPLEAVKHNFLRSRANSIEGGTAEIMRNILGERVLGLPGEPRVDKDVAWKDVPRS
jgi:alkylation response protein AidB-like acyl-CoA dehydrogenase